MPARPPETPTVDVVDDVHGHRVPDPYRWLEELDAPAVQEWVRAQNAHTEAWLETASTLRAALHGRLTELLDHPRRGAPSRRGRWWFWLANDGLSHQDALMVADRPEGEPRTLVDPNQLATDGTVALAGATVSHDGERVAYALSEGGSDWMTWHVAEVATGTPHPDRVAWAKFAGAAWAPDGSGFFYGRFDAPSAGEAHGAAHRGHQVWFHRLGADQGDDRLIHHAPEDPDLVFSPRVTDDGRWLLVTGSRGTERRSGVWATELAEVDPAAVTLQPLLTAFDALYAVVDTDESALLVLTDAGAPRRRLVRVDLAAPAREHWRELIGEHDQDTLEQVERVGDRLVCVWLHHARHRVTVHALDGSPVDEIGLGELGSVAGLSGRRDDRVAHVVATGFTRPPSIRSYDLHSGETRVVWQPAVPFDPDRFVTEQVWVTSTDGEQVPAFVVRRADTRLADGDHPTLLWGYGGFSISVTPMFRTWWLAWLERGGVLVVPNLRGGGEFGAQWHDAGKLGRKQQVFDDAIAVAEWLVDKGWTRPARLAISGGSNGGLLVGACLTQRPDLFGAAVPEVGVLDMLRFHQFTIGWAWASDYGTVDDPEQAEWLLAYSPLHRIEPGTAYPPTLVVTGDTDDRVVPAHSYKFAAALQAANASRSSSEAVAAGSSRSSSAAVAAGSSRSRSEAVAAGPALLRVETRAGHGMGKPTGVVIEERADVLAFLCRTVGAGLLDSPALADDRP